MIFTSQICTTEEQSKRLLALGLKRETADCVIMYYDGWHVGEAEHFDFDKDPVEPAWSLHRLIEMMPSFIDIGEHTYMFSIIQGKLFSYGSDIAGNGFLYGKGSVYDSAIYTIEWLIKEGHFNKEYLE
jgi:hypothetical protein